MNRRQLLLSLGAALVVSPLLLSTKAWGKSDRPAKLLLKFGGTLYHRGELVDRDKVKLRVACFDSGMGRKVLWEEEVQVRCEQGAFYVELGRRGSLGTALENPLPKDAHLGFTVLSMGPAVQDLSLTPRVAVDWEGSGTADCLEVIAANTAIEALDAGGVCVVTGEGAVRLEITQLQRAEKD